MNLNPTLIMYRAGYTFGAHVANSVGDPLTNLLVDGCLSEPFNEGIWKPTDWSKALFWNVFLGVVHPTARFWKKPSANMPSHRNVWDCGAAVPLAGSIPPSNRQPFALRRELGLLNFPSLCPSLHVSLCFSLVVHSSFLLLSSLASFLSWCISPIWFLIVCCYFSSLSLFLSVCFFLSSCCSHRISSTTEQAAFLPPTGTRSSQLPSSPPVCARVVVFLSFGAFVFLAPLFSRLVSLSCCISPLRVLILCCYLSSLSLFLLSASSSATVPLRQPFAIRREICLLNSLRLCTCPCDSLLWCFRRLCTSLVSLGLSFLLHMSATVSHVVLLLSSLSAVAATAAAAVSTGFVRE